jgi:hypothetical protein
MIHSLIYASAINKFYCCADEELAYIKQDQYLLEFAVHIGYIFTPALTSVFLVKTANAKIPIILGVIIASLATFFAPGAIQTSLFRGMWARIVFGAGFGMTLVSLFQLIAVWIPRDEVSEIKSFSQSFEQPVDQSIVIAILSIQDQSPSSRVDFMREFHLEIYGVQSS